MAPSPPPPTGPPQRRYRVADWLDRETGWRNWRHEALNEPIPGGSRWAYVFGSGLLFLFVSQIITGVFLALYYVPSADHAHISVAFITKVVQDGQLIRGVHYYGAGAMIVVLLLHVTQTIVYGSYKGRRHLLWLVGCLLFLLVLAMGFTGYLLPWDQRAYWATTVGTNIISEVPWFGSMLQRILRGGASMGTLTISRFFVLHVLVLPAFLIWLIGGHVLLFRRAGAAGPTEADPIEPHLATANFWPGQVVKDVVFTVLLIAGLAALAHWRPITLGPPANPSNTTYVPRPEWYYLPIFEWLKLWSGREEIWGIFIVPLFLLFLFAGYPFLDRKRDRRPWKRPGWVGAYLLALGSLFFLGWLSHHQDESDPAIARALARQKAQTHAYMAQPFRPEVTGAALTAPASPLIAVGQKLFETNACVGCHGPGGSGTSVAPALVGIASQFNPVQLTRFLEHLPAAVAARGMPPVPVHGAKLQALVAYLESLH